MTQEFPSAEAPDMPMNENRTFEQWLSVIDTQRVNHRAYRALGIDAELAQRDAQFEAWKNDPTFWGTDGRPAVGTPDHALILKALHFTHGIMGDPFHSAFAAWAMQNPDFAFTLPADMPADMQYDLFRAEMLEAFGQALTTPGPDGKKRVSPLYDGPLNNTYLARGADGKWQSVSEEKLIALMQDPNGPRIQLTGNHAFFETPRFDLDMLTGTFKEIVSAVNKIPVKEEVDGALVEVMKDHPNLKFAGIDEELGPNDTIQVCSTFSRENNFLNLASLFRRVYDLKAHFNHPQADPFAHSSPMTTRFTGLLLRALGVDSARITTPAFVNGVQQWPTSEARMVAEGSPIAIREDAGDILSRISFEGFSMAGNSMCDMGRLLRHQFDFTNAAKQPLLNLPKGWVLPDVMRRISILSGSYNETEMPEYYKKAGLSIIHYENAHDTYIAPPPVNFEHELDRQVVIYNATADYDGHAPRHHRDGALSDPAMNDRYRCVYAAHVGRAALTGVVPTVNDKGERVLQLVLAATTGDALFEKHIPELRAALAKAGLEGFDVVRNNTHGLARYELRASDPNAWNALKHRVDGDTPMLVKQLKNAFGRLEKNDTAGLLISCDVQPELDHALRDWVTDNWRGQQAVISNGRHDGVLQQRARNNELRAITGV